jgi:hypothetical protein
LRTGVIRDRNGNAVPDDTTVQFTISYLSEGLGFDVPQPEVLTVHGVARIDIPLNVPGQLQIKASSGEARASVGLAVSVFEDQPPIIEEITPIPTNTPTPVPPTSTPVPTEAFPTPTATSTPTPTSTPSPIIVPYNPTEPRIVSESLVLSMIGMLVLAGGAFVVGWTTKRNSWAWSVRLSLLTLVGGLLGYNYYVLALPGTEQLWVWMGSWSATMLAWSASLLTLFASVLWFWRYSE